MLVVVVVKCCSCCLLLRLLSSVVIVVGGGSTVVSIASKVLARLASDSEAWRIGSRSAETVSAVTSGSVQDADI